MSKRFVVRIELHGVEDGDDAYETLHKEMDRRNFSRTINMTATRDDGDHESREHRLPRGTYIAKAASVGGTRQTAMKYAKQAVKKTGHDASIVVVETDQILNCSGLEAVEDDEEGEDDDA